MSATTFVECHPVRARLPAILGLLTSLTLATAGVAAAAKGGFSPVAPESPNADRIQTTYWVVFGFAVAVFVVVEVLLVLYIVRYRSRGRGREVEGPQVRGHTRVELAWTAVPVLILAAIAVFTFYKLPGIKNVPEAGAAGNLQIGIQGRQFYWEFTYPNGVIAVNRMRVPVSRVVELNVTSPTTDVIHSWWIPSLGGKIDAIPGKMNHTWFQATKTGTYKGRCAEFCGIQHAEMRADVQALPAPAFYRWLQSEARAQTEGTSGLGQQTFEGVCAPCHGMQGEGGIGPPLKGSSLLTDEKSLTTLLENGGKLMPAVGKGWSALQKHALFAYVARTIAKGQTSGG